MGLDASETENHWVQSHLRSDETIHQTLEVRSTRVVVTSERLITLQAGGVSEYGNSGHKPTESVQAVQLEEVEGVRLGTDGNRAWMLRSLYAGGLGTPLLFLAFAFDFRSLIGDPAIDGSGAETFGGSGLVEGLELILRLFTQLDLILAGVGGLLLAVAVGFAGIHWRFERQPTLVIETTAGTSDLSLPRPDDPEETMSRLERAVVSAIDASQRDLAPDDSTSNDASDSKDGPSESTSGGFVSDE